VLFKCERYFGNNKPLFGICLGHQVGLANGISTYKMFNGHRGINHPVKLLLEKVKYFKNHGFAVNKEELKTILIWKLHIFISMMATVAGGE
jgi:carbamoylphosphate synthase small subunit